MNPQPPSPAGQPGEPVDPRAADPLHHAGTPTTCRWCSASTAIVWVKTKANKAAMPIEVGVNESGNVEIVFEHDPATGRDVALAVVHASPPGMLEDWVPYMPHHATCARNVQGARSSEAAWAKLREDEALNLGVTASQVRNLGDLWRPGRPTT